MCFSARKVKYHTWKLSKCVRWNKRQIKHLQHANTLTNTEKKRIERIPWEWKRQDVELGKTRWVRIISHDHDHGHTEPLNTTVTYLLVLPAQWFCKIIICRITTWNDGRAQFYLVLRVGSNVAITSSITFSRDMDFSNAICSCYHVWGNTSLCNTATHRVLHKWKLRDKCWTRYFKQGTWCIGYSSCYHVYKLSL